ncbi:MAG: hypothetical protein AUJ98_10485 [Bacteroidetes bacterium CG2_30_33_31]|nr:MAG: hypothetical protein AUJ98_10485 [Bacteroidetes bacterium CG2_30_33_31]
MVKINCQCYFLLKCYSFYRNIYLSQLLILLKNNIKLNMRNHKITILIFSFLFSFFMSNAQKTWSLQDCVDYALFHNIDLKLQELSVQIQENNVFQSRMNLLPNLTANASDVNNWGKTVDRYTNQFANSRVSSANFYLQSSVTLFRGFQLLNSIKRENLELMAQKYDFDAQRDMKAMEITTAYLQILYGQENLKSKIQLEGNTILQVERTQKLVDAGTLAKGDLFNMKAQLASEETQKILAENDLSMAYIKLKQILDIPADTAFEIQIPSLDLTQGDNKLMSPEVIYNYAVQSRPEIMSAQIRYERSLRDLSIARSSFYPSISFSAGLGTGYSGANIILDGNPSFNGFFPSGDITSAGDTVLSPSFDYRTKTKAFSDQITENKNYSVGVYLTMPIFNNFQTRNQIVKSKIAIQQADLQLEKTKKDVRQTIEQAYADARSAFKSYQAAMSNVNALEESFNYAKQKFDAGMINSYQFNDSKIKLDNAKNDLLNSKYNYVFRIKVLDFYFGKPLSL